MNLPSNPTKDVLLDAAERLFAAHGIARSSLRAITQEAGTNLASVNYHFGSKDALIRAVFARRIRPINGERLRRLDALEAEGTPSVSQIARAFVAPILRMMRDPDHTPQAIAQLMSRAFSEPGDEVRTILVAEFRPILERFTAAFARVLPHLSAEEIFWRFHFMVGSMVHTVTAGLLRKHFGPPGNPVEVEALDTDILEQRLVAFVTAGFSTAACGDPPEAGEHP
ncbi:MAG: TetR/AcrR family transcriptional regulator [Acidobacteriota bacterium]